MSKISRCEFMGGKCDHNNGEPPFCGYYYPEHDKCSWFDDLPPGMPPRMFYNDQLIQVRKELDI